MRNRRVLAVLGGNAFAPPGRPLTMRDQFRFAREALAALLPLVESDVGLVITHGNGPQVGHILIRVEEALGKAYSIPLEVCVAESEGELGYVLEQSLYNLLVEQGIHRPIAGLLTQVVVDEKDPAFADPTKPIGPYYDAAQAEEMRRGGFAVREDAGRGFRRVVPSPRPREIVEAETIGRLLDLGILVIAAGGGGIPVVRRDGRLEGVEAVVDKDLASALLGDVLGAELLVILTGVPCAYRHFGAPEQEPIGRIAPDEADRLQAEGHFAPGSMGPKIEAAAQFARLPGRRAIICDPPSLAAALEGRAGTIVESSRSGCA
jgi:carbamate kinase